MSNDELSDEVLAAGDQAAAMRRAEDSMEVRCLSCHHVFVPADNEPGVLCPKCDGYTLSIERRPHPLARLDADPTRLVLSVSPERVAYVNAIKMSSSNLLEFVQAAGAADLSEEEWAVVLLECGTMAGAEQERRRMSLMAQAAMEAQAGGEGQRLILPPGMRRSH